jgi:predicted kinase
MQGLRQLPEPVVKPILIVVSGLPGTGKTYFSSKLAERLSIVVLESDNLRKILFTPPIYSSTENARLFRAIHCLINKLLKKGISVIFDATNLSEMHRERLYSIADHLDVQLTIIRVEAPVSVVRERLKVRREAKDIENKSDAGWEVYSRMKPLVQKIHRNHYVLDTSRDITPVLNKIVRRVIR